MEIMGIDQSDLWPSGMRMN